eukprot:7387748-Prymnesium_polylepis.1
MAATTKENELPRAGGAGASALLAGVVAVVTGRGKEETEALLAQLGAKTVAKLQKGLATHLVWGKEGDAALYWQAKKSGGSIEIVAKEWVKGCEEDSERVDPDEYKLRGAPTEEESAAAQPAPKRTPKPATPSASSAAAASTSSEPARTARRGVGEDVAS